MSTIANDLPVFLAVWAQMMFGALHWWCQLCFLPGRGCWERADPQWCSVWLLELRCSPTETSVEKCSEIVDSQKILREARTWRQTTDIIIGKVLSPHSTIYIKIKKIKLKYTIRTIYHNVRWTYYLFIPWQWSGSLRLLFSCMGGIVGHQVRGRRERWAECGEGTVAREDAHHQMTPSGKVHVHLGCSEKVLPWQRKQIKSSFHCRNTNSVWINLFGGFCVCTSLFSEDAPLTSQLWLPFEHSVNKSKL